MTFTCNRCNTRCEQHQPSPLANLQRVLLALFLQCFGDGSDVLQSFQQLNTGLHTLQQQHTLSVGFLLLHHHLQPTDGKVEDVVANTMVGHSHSLLQILQCLHFTGQ